MARWVLMLLGPTYLLSAGRTYPMLRLERQLEFGKIARIELAVTLTRHVGAIALGLLKAGVMALVLSNVGSLVLGLVLTFVLMPGLPPLRFRWGAFRPLLAFGLTVQALTITAFFKDNLSNLLLGALLGPEAVGMFNRGLAYVGIPMLIVNGLARIQLPTYARGCRTIPRGCTSRCAARCGSASSRACRSSSSSRAATRRSSRSSTERSGSRPARSPRPWRSAF